MRVIVALALWLGFARLCVAAPEPGEASARIAVLAAPEDGQVVSRLGDELGALGFDVTPGALPPSEPTPSDLQAMARSLDVAAAIAIYTGEEQLTIWIVDRITGKILLRSTGMPPPTEGDRARLIALRAVELLRASFRELERDAHPPGQEVQRSAPARALLRPATPRFAFDVAPAIAGSTAAVGPSVHVSTGVRWFPHPRWSLALRGLIPTVPPRVEADEGFARITIGMVDVGAHVGLRPPAKLLQPELGAAVGLAVLRMDGVAQSPARGTTDHVLSATIRVSGGLAVSIHPRLRLRLDGSLGVLLPRPAVVFVDREVADWGQPYGLGSLGLEVIFE